VSTCFNCGAEVFQQDSVLCSRCGTRLGQSGGGSSGQTGSGGAAAGQACSSRGNGGSTNAGGGSDRAEDRPDGGASDGFHKDLGPRLAAARERLQLLRDEAERHGFDEVVARIDSRLADLDEPLLVFVVGEGNFGKSTLINRLAGKNIAATARVPKTWRIDLYQGCDGKGERAVLKTISARQGAEVPIDKAQRLCDEEETRMAASKRWDSELYQVSWYRDISWPRSDAALVDTPGFSQLRLDTSARILSLYGGDGIKLAIDEAFYSYYYRADAVLWCFKATRLQDIDSLETLEKVAVEGKPIVGVVTHMDEVPKDRWDEILGEARRIFGEHVDQFVPFAGEGDESLVQGSIRSLRSVVDERYISQARDRKLESAERFLSVQQAEFCQWLSDVAGANLENTGICVRAQASIRQAVAQAKSELAARLERDQRDEFARLSSRLTAIWASSHNDEHHYEYAARQAIEQSGASDRMFDRAREARAAVHAKAEMTLHGVALKSLLLGHDRPSRTYLSTSEMPYGLLFGSGGDQRVRLSLGTLPKTGVEFARLHGFNPQGIVAGFVQFINESRRRKRAQAATAEALSSWLNNCRRTTEEAFKSDVARLEDDCVAKIEREFEIFSGRKLASLFNWNASVDKTLLRLGARSEGVRVAVPPKGMSRSELNGAMQWTPAFLQLHRQDGRYGGLVTEWESKTAAAWEPLFRAAGWQKVMKALKDMREPAYEAVADVAYDTALRISPNDGGALIPSATGRMNAHADQALDWLTATVTRAVNKNLLIDKTSPTMLSGDRLVDRWPVAEQAVLGALRQARGKLMTSERLGSFAYGVRASAEGQFRTRIGCLPVFLAFLGIYFFTTMLALTFHLWMSWWLFLVATALVVGPWLYVRHQHRHRQADFVRSQIWPFAHAEVDAFVDTLKGVMDDAVQTKLLKG
jgi:GTPase SAR1 family protein